MYTGSDLRKDISDVVLAAREKGMRAHCAWITTEVCNRHPKDGDSDFWTLTGHIGTQREVRSYLNAMKLREDEESDSGQNNLPGVVIMPGFKYLQKSYFVADPNDPQGAPMLIPTPEMTDEQIDMKIREKQRMAAGNLKHAEELERYKKDRRRAA